MACTVTLPALASDDSCPTVKTGQIFKAYFTRATSEDVLTDVTDDAEWATRLDQDAVIPGSGPAPIREWSVVGSKAEGEVSEVELPLNQVYSIKGNTTIALRCYDLTATNLAAVKTYNDAGSVKQKAWFAFADQIIGGDAGINGSLRVDLVIPEGSQELSYIALNFTFKGSLGGFDATPLPAFASY
jgi:hypothetical protein